ncbi:MAG: hypothetical protein R3D65_11670 [Zhengella sp.]|uniref:hypothetical protein n=1 Tax=Zhengella sp. TaxID=2282762 RepID=UPI0035293CB2
MRLRTLIPAMALLSATALSGCVSQNATAMLPQEVQLALAADAARQSVPEATEPEANMDAATGERETAPALSAVEMEYRRQVARLAADRPEGVPSTGKGNAVALFNQARQLQAVRAMAQPSSQTESPSPAAQDLTPEATWNAALAKARASTPPAPAGADTTITTAAVGTGPKPADVIEFQLESATTQLPAETVMQLRLRKLGGRVVRRIVVGRIAGEGYEVLARAQQIARVVASVTGGEPGMGYDPSMSAGAVRVEYEPFAGAAG